MCLLSKVGFVSTCVSSLEYILDFWIFINFGECVRVGAGTISCAVFHEARVYRYLQRR